MARRYGEESLVWHPLSAVPTSYELLRQGKTQDVGYYAWTKGKWESVANLKDLDKRLQQPSLGSEGDKESVRNRFEDEVRKAPGRL